MLLYTEFANLDSVNKGSKVQFAAWMLGRQYKIDVPSCTNRPISRTDEGRRTVSRPGSNRLCRDGGYGGRGWQYFWYSPYRIARYPDCTKADFILQSKPPVVTISDLLTNGLGVMNDADATMKQVAGAAAAIISMGQITQSAMRMICSWDSMRGAGPVEMLLRDEKGGKSDPGHHIDRANDDVEPEAIGR